MIKYRQASCLPPAKLAPDFLMRFLVKIPKVLADAFGRCKGGVTVAEPVFGFFLCLVMLYSLFWLGSESGLALGVMTRRFSLVGKNIPSSLTAR